MSNILYHCQTLDLYLIMGYNCFMNPKIEFVSMIEGLESIEECRPKPAKNFIPHWFKDIPSGAPETVKNCPSFPDYFSMGYVLPMWTDIRLKFNKETSEYNWQTPSSLFTVDIHSIDQFVQYVSPSFSGVDGDFIFKTNSPWKIITPKGWSVLQLPLFYHFNKEWSVMPGVIDTDVMHDMNQQILYHGNGSEIEIKRGTPLVLYIPFKRDSVDIDLDVRFVNEKDKKIFNRSDLNFETLFPPGVYRKMQRERDKNV
jgi:hypothetical protein